LKRRYATRWFYISPPSISTVFEERRIEAGVIPNISYIRIYEQESNRTRARNNTGGGKERTPGTRRHKPEDVREYDFVCDMLLLCFWRADRPRRFSGRKNK
jgi:hypothetical protein